MHFADKMSTSEQEKLNALLARAMQRWSRGHKARGQGHKKILGQG